jgi:hypothetical protein
MIFNGLHAVISQMIGSFIIIPMRIIQGSLRFSLFILSRVLGFTTDNNVFWIGLLDLLALLLQLLLITINYISSQSVTA